MKKRARRRGIKFNLTWLDLYPAVCGGVCELTGLRFKKSRWQRNPFASSVDRKDSSKGYIRGNVRVVLWAVNCAFNLWGQEVYEQIARAYMENQLVVKTRDN